MPEDQVKIEKKQSEYSHSDGPEYPFGTSIHLTDELLEQMGVGELAPGDMVNIRGIAFVESKNEHSDTDESRKSMSFQFTTMKIQREESDRVKQLYGKE